MKKILTSFLVLLFLALGVFNIYRKIVYREISDGFQWQEEETGLTVKGIGKNDFFPPLKSGDLLLEIDGIVVNDTLDRLELINQKGEKKKVVYFLSREGQYIYSQGTLRKSRFPMVYLYLVITGMASLFLVYYTLFQPSSLSPPSQTLFFLTGLSFYSLYVFTSDLVINDIWAKLFYSLDKSGFLLFPAFFFHFFLLFPTEQKRWSLFKVIFYLAGGVLLLLNLLGLFGIGSFVSLQSVFYQNTLRRIELAYFSSAFLLTLLVIVLRFYRSETLYVRKQMKGVVWGILAGFVPFFLFYILPFFSSPDPPEWAQFIVLTQLLIPLTFAYAVSGYKLMDFEILAKRYAVYISGFLIVFSLYAFIITRFAPDFEGGVTIGAAAILIGVLVLNPLYTFLEELINRLFYRRTYASREDLVSFSRIVTAEKDLPVLTSRFLEILLSALLLKDACLYLFQKESGEFRLLGAKGSEDRPLPNALPLSVPFREKLLENDFLWLYSLDETEGFAPQDRDVLQNLGMYHLLPLLFEGKLIGLLTMGRKIDGGFLTTEDWSLLLAIIPSFSLAVENASLYTALTHRLDEINSLKEFSESILESVQVGIAVIDDTGEVLHWNRYMENFFSRPRRDAVGKPLLPLLGVETAPSPPSPGEGSNRRITLTDGQGRQRLTEVTLFPLNSRDHANILLLSDVTEKADLERELITKEKMASLGLLSAGIVHEINTPLTGISSYSQLLKSSTSDPEIVELGDRIEAQAERMRQLIRSLLNFSREGRGVKVIFDLREAVEELRTILEHKIKEKGILFQIQGGSLLLSGERVKIQQALINLLINAIDASSTGSEVTLRANRGQGRVVIEVEDRGEGIAQDDLPYIFDPFFTRKGPGKGTGLGLSIVFNIVKEHGGTIDVSSQLGKGTTFRISFPEPSLSRPGAVHAL